MKRKQKPLRRWWLIALVLLLIIAAIVWWMQNKSSLPEKRIAEQRQRLQAARVLWEARPFDSYVFQISHEQFSGSADTVYCVGDDIECPPNGRRDKTMDDLFNEVATSLEARQPGPNSFQCDGYLYILAEYDGGLGYPVHTENTLTGNTYDGPCTLIGVDPQPRRIELLDTNAP